MFYQQHEGNQKLFDLETRVIALEAKLEIESLSESLMKNIKNNVDELFSNSLTVNCIKEEMERRYKRSRLDLAEFVKEYKKSEKDIRENQEKLNSFSEEFNKLKLFLSDIVTDLKLKAYTGDLNRLERLLDGKFPASTGNELVEQMKLRAKHEDLVKTQEEINDFQNFVQENYMKKEKTLEELQKIQTTLVESLENYSTKEFTNAITTKIYRKTSEIESELEKFDQRMTNITEIFEKMLKDLKSEMNDKISFKDLEKLSQEIASKASKHDLTKYVADIAPKISGFQSEIGVFNRIIREQEQAMLRLDEVLLDKASKIETNDLYNKLELISRHANIEYKIDEMINKQTQIREDFDLIQSDLRTMQIQFSEIQTAYIKKVNENLELKFLKDLMLEMQTSISYKADRTETLNCLEKKAG